MNIQCPRCKAPEPMFSKKRQIFICEECGHEFTQQKPFAPLRIFLSYGQDEHVALALRLRDDLRERGHEVWFDEERLLPGHDWELFIEQGLLRLAGDKANAAVLLLLTPHSVRRPDGFCLNEVARALAHCLRIVPLMVVESEPPLSICRIQWLDMRECIPIHEKESLYRPRFERLLKAIEDNQLDFEGVQNRLLKVLQPIAFFFTGRFFLYQNMPDTALIAYLEGLRICLSDQNSAYSKQIQAEIDFLYHLERLKHGLPGYDVVFRLMLLARFFKTHFTAVDPKSLNEPDVRRLRETADNSLQQMKTLDITYQGPVVVLTGSCAAADESRMAGFQTLLDQAFAHFAGTVISGGTLSGVGKLAGSLQENHPSGQLHAMAYLPRSMPAHARPDIRYHRHIMTTGLDFSPLEPLQMWIDLLASGMDPGQIKLVGIGGGDISAFEYRLALTLGAQVGIITGSGRAADELLTNPAWKDIQHALDLSRILIVLCSLTRYRCSDVRGQGRPIFPRQSYTDGPRRLLHVVV
jgi:hypothetical protein